MAILSFPLSGQLYIITENGKRRGRLERMARIEVRETKMVHKMEKPQGYEDSALRYRRKHPAWEIDNVCYACLGIMW